MSAYPSGASVADYIAVAITEGIAKDGQHTLADRTNALLRVYAFSTGDSLEGVPVGSPQWWGVLAEVLEIGIDLAVLTRNQRGRIEADIDQAIARSTPSTLGITAKGDGKADVGSAPVST